MTNVNLDFYITEVNTICAWINNMLDMSDVYDLESALEIMRGVHVHSVYDFNTFGMSVEDENKYARLRDRIGDYLAYLEYTYNEVLYN